jgi:hypothetical protein
MRGYRHAIWGFTLLLCLHPPRSSCATAAEEEDFICTATFKLYDPAQVTSLRFAMPQFANASCISLIEGTGVTYESLALDMTGFPEGFQGPSPLVSCTEVFQHADCPPELDDLPVTIYEATGPDGGLASIPAICAQRVECGKAPCGEDDFFVQIECGDADGSGHIRANDALSALRSAVGLTNCLPQRCDADRDGVIQASDARAILATSVGLSASLVCPPPCESYPPGT